MTPAFFVVGTGRCGTNLLRTILDAHPDVHVVRETHWIPHLLERFGHGEAPFAAIYAEIQRVHMPNGMTAFDRIAHRNDTTGPALWADFQKLRPASTTGTTGTVADFMSTYYELVAKRNGAVLCADKTPDYGVHMAALAELWPDAPFVHIYRDGRDVALSMREVQTFRHLVASGGRDWLELGVDMKFEKHAEAVEGELPLTSFFELWRRRFTAIRKEAQHLPASRYMEIRYEDLLASPRHSIAAIGAFSGITRFGAGRGPRWVQQWRNLRWRKQASRLIRPTNLGRNAQSEEYAWLGRTYGETIEEMTEPGAAPDARLRGLA